MISREEALKQLRRALATRLAFYGAIVIFGLAALWWLAGVVS